ncbi:MAG: hypothetical protein CMO44_10980 [Verrucomicrobiales bacterium]|nr:hypothetical protein [Verrucomicrobiales bacterium]|tara:strand:- start:3352 stop:3906 length:555 start_codon:yes stop_codon:yes gene_type:complete
MAYLGVGNNDVVELRNTRYRYVATEGQTVFTGADGNGSALINMDSANHVFLNGAKLSPDGDFTTNGTNIVLATAAYLNDILEIIEITKVTVADAGGAVKRSGDTLTGNLSGPTFRPSRVTQATNADAVKRSETPYLGSNSIIRTNANNITENITIDSSTNGMSAGPIEIDSGYTVTVNGEWSIV